MPKKPKTEEKKYTLLQAADMLLACNGIFIETTHKAYPTAAEIVKAMKK